jgi:hypothetical protein
MPPDDLYPEMRRFPIDEESAQRLLSGNVEPDDAPPGYAYVAALVRVAQASAAADETLRRDTDISALTAALGVPATASTTPEGTRMISKRFVTKALAIAIPALALTATGAAAATGSLPTPAQSALHGAFVHVGVSVPSGGPSTTDNSGNSGTHAANNANAVGPDATGAAKFGLCRAWIASGGHMSSNSVAFRNLKQAAGSAGVASFCAGVTPGNGKSGNTGSSDSGNGTSAPDEPPSSVPGKPSSTPAGPPSSTPGSDHTKSSVPAGPPNSTPGSDHTTTSVPAGPSTSTPASRP